jgi:stage II sporulation protein D
MKKKRHLLYAPFLIGALLFVTVCPETYGSGDVIIRVGLVNGREKLSLEVKGPYEAKALHSDIVLDTGRALRTTRVIPTTSGLKIGEKEYKVYGIRIIPEKDASIYIDKRRFRGIVDVMRTEEMKVMVVNHLDVEKYLYGVLYHETPHYWPIEVLKAQAIVARTFALHRIETMKDRDYDVTSDVYSQVYGGRASERWKTVKAVNATRGKVLTYKGKIFPAYYHSMCAGHTEDAEIVFGLTLPPLKGRSCPYCKGAPHMSWKEQFSYKQIEAKLKGYGIAVKGLRHIAEGKRDESGRLVNVRISDAAGTREIKGYKFRLAMGPNVIKSTNFTIRISSRGVLFRGKGWGHGVGMCQWGAFGMGRRWSGHKQILAFYYPGATIAAISVP